MRLFPVERFSIREFSGNTLLLQFLIQISSIQLARVSALFPLDGIFSLILCSCDRLGQFLTNPNAIIISLCCNICPLFGGECKTRSPVRLCWTGVKGKTYE